jgi:TonB family protein
MIVTVKVVIRKDGTVESAVVSQGSGSSKLDANIRQLLARVKTIGAPFPDGAKESKRTYTIDFNLKAKLGPG